MDRRREPMTSQRKKTAPPTPRRPRSSSSSRKGLMATEKTKKQSAKKRTALDNRFHRTPTLSCTRAPSAGLPAARRLPRPTAQPEEARSSRCDATQLVLPLPRNGPRVSSSEELGDH